MDKTDSRLAHPTGPASDDAASPFNSQPVPADVLGFEPVPLRQRRDGLTPQKQREYVEALADTGVVREAAARIGISEQAINRVRRRSDARDFDRACEAAHMFGARRLRSIAFERAIEGTLKGHYYHGELVSQERVHDNRLLIYLLGKTAHLLEPGERAKAVCEHWEPCMEALERGLPAPGPVPADPAEADRQVEEPENPQVWFEDGAWWTYFPPPAGFDGEEEGDSVDGDYRRTLTADEEAVMKARSRAGDEAELARCCALRDRYFGLPPRGCSEDFFPQASRNNEPSETSGEEEDAEEENAEGAEEDAEGAEENAEGVEEDAEGWGEGPIEYKSMEPPASSRRRPGSVSAGVRDPGRPCSAIPEQVRDDGAGTPDDSRPPHIQTRLPRHPC